MTEAIPVDRNEAPAAIDIGNGAMQYLTRTLDLAANGYCDGGSSPTEAMLREAADAIRALRLSLTAAEKDAKRYEWLRRIDTPANETAKCRMFEFTSGEELDEYIDAAIAKESK